MAYWAAYVQAQSRLKTRRRGQGLGPPGRVLRFAFLVAAFYHYFLCATYTQTRADVMQYVHYVVHMVCVCVCVRKRTYFF